MQIYKTKVQDARGRMHDVVYHKATYMGPDGKVEGLIGVIIEITERVQAEAARARLATAVEQSAEMILITDTDGTILYANPAFAKTTGYPCTEAIGQNPRILKSGKQNAAFYRDLWATLKRGEVFSLLGPSGCGKTTLLRLLAGFLSPDAGRIRVAGKDLTAVPPNKRPINTVFQNYALFPHLSIHANIAFGLKVAGKPRAVIAEEVERMLDLIQMQEHAEKRPHQISGGQKQRVAIARALVNKPQLLLLDEPLAALDLKLRQRMLLELDRIHDEVGITFLYVTHDQGEAMSLSDRIAVMHNGRIEQLGTPAEIYESPRSRFVADFIGDANIFEGRVESVVESNYVRLVVDSLDPGHSRVVAWKDRPLGPGDPVHLSVRWSRRRSTSARRPSTACGSASG